MMRLRVVVVVVAVVVCALCGSRGAQAYNDTECPEAPLVAEDRRTNQDLLRVTQYNVDWLYTQTYDGCPGSTCPWKNQTMAEEHVAAIASVLADLNSDIVNFAEIEGCNELKQLNTYLSGYGYEPYLVFGDDSYTGEMVGLLTRIDPKTNMEFSRETYTYPVDGSLCGYDGDGGSKELTKHYVTTMEFNGMNVAILGAHMLAFPTDPTRCAQREAQAYVARNLLQNYFDDGYEVIIIGDMNDWDAEITDKNFNEPTSQVLNILKGLDTPYVLTNVAEFLEQEQRYTDWYDNHDFCVQDDDELSMIDHILVSEGLLQYVKNVHVGHEYYIQSCDPNFYYSDHWPVTVDFDFSTRRD